MYILILKMAITCLQNIRKSTLKCLKGVPNMSPKMSPRCHQDVPISCYKMSSSQAVILFFFGLLASFRQGQEELSNSKALKNCMIGY